MYGRRNGINIVTTLSGITESDSLKTRNSGFELLRILSMFMILYSHFFVHSEIAYPVDEISINRLWSQSMILGNFGSNIFILISGYFLYGNKKAKTEKLVRMMSKAVFYSLLLFVLIELFTEGGLGFSALELVKSCFPVVFQKWWFLTAYVIAYILSPYLNSYVKKTNKKTLQKIIISFFIFWSVIQSFTHQTLACSDLLWFLYLYLISFYIRKYSDDFANNAKRYFILSFMFYLGYVASVFIIDCAGLVLPVGQYAEVFCYKTSIFLFPASVLLLLGFKNTRFKYSKAINSIAGTMFGVYLIHEHPSLRQLIWKSFLLTKEYINNGWFIFYSLMVCFMFFLICICIEWIQECIEKSRVGISVINRISELVDALIVRITDVIKLVIQKGR